MRTEQEIEERLEDLYKSLEEVKRYSDDWFEIHRRIDDLKWVLDKD